MTASYHSQQNGMSSQRYRRNSKDKEVTIPALPSSMMPSSSSSSPAPSPLLVKSFLVGSVLCSSVCVHGFTFHNKQWRQNPAFVVERPRSVMLSTTTRPRSSSSSSLYIRAPPGSGYQDVDDEPSFFPDSYEPMMEYPGTMRPGRTPENAPFQDLPLGDEYSERDPVPWPHFQQIEWHHQWAPPHEAAIPMEEFIEQQGRWATPEQEAMMRAGTRRASMARREAEMAKKSDTLIVDDEDDDDEAVDDLPQDLGEGIFGNLGSTDDAKITAAATSPDEAKRKSALMDTDDDDDDDDDVDISDAGLDDFLLDLGLDSFDDEDDVDSDDDDDDDDDDAGDVGSSTPSASSVEAVKPGLTQSLEDVVITEVSDDDDLLVTDEVDDDTDSPDETASIDVDDDDELDLGLDEEDDFSGDDSSDVPLEDLEENDIFDSNEFFEDGGWDYDDGDSGDFDGDGFD